jgi:hypothetical protein
MLGLVDLLVPLDGAEAAPDQPTPDHGEDEPGGNDDRQQRKPVRHVTNNGILLSGRKR